MIIGNKDIRDRLIRLSKTEQLHHCLLFEGPKGVGKYLHAIWLSKLINCTGEDQLRAEGPCSRCWSCRMIDKGEHHDIITISYDPEKTAKVISVRQAREIISNIQVHPFRARKRVVIIEPAEAMRIEAANALLKTFEEPPSSTMFILICDFAAQLLPTIRSRVQRIRFRPVPTEELREWLISKHSSSEVSSIPLLSEGSPGQAILMLEEKDEWISMRNDFLDVIQRGPTGQQKWLASFLSGSKPKWLPELHILLDVIATLLRDWVLLSFSSTIPLYHEDIRARLLCFHHNPVQLGKLFDALAQIHNDMRIHVNERLLMEAFFAKCFHYLVEPVKKLS